MKKEKLDLSQWKNIKARINTTDHNLVQILTAAYGNGPDVRVEIKDVVLDTVTFSPDKDVSTLQPILYKRNNRWFLIVGSGAIDQAIGKKELILEAKLISTPALKACRIEVPQPAMPAALPVVTAPVRYTPPPRREWTDKPTRTTPGPNTRRDRP